VTETVDAADAALPSLTTSEKVRVVEVDGALKVGLAVAGLVRATVGPEVWLQEYVRPSPSTSLLALPSRVTCVALKTVRA